MQLTLNNEEARVLHAILADYLPQLRMERARTDVASREMRHELVKRVELCEQLLYNLEQVDEPASQRGATDTSPWEL